MSRWEGIVEGHIGDSGNSVWQVVVEGRPHVLRLGDPTYRTVRECCGELAYIRHLHDAGLRVALPVVSRNKLLVEDVTVDAERMLASLFRWAPGERVGPTSRHWGDPLFREWGQTLARIHNASDDFLLPPDGDRWIWRDELFLRHADDLIPKDDTEAWRVRNEIYDALDRLPVGPDIFGMTHGDFAPQNFHYDPTIGITTFDFGNACSHWFISDLAITLTTIRGLSDRDAITEQILSGYREIRPIDTDMLAALDTFTRLRFLYAWLSRLMKFGESPTEGERGILESMRGWVVGSL